MQWRLERICGGIEIVWLEIGNEKAGHIFQVSSRAGCLIVLWSNDYAMLTCGFKARQCRSSILDLLFIHKHFDVGLKAPEVALLVLLSRIKHLLRDPFLPYDGLDSSDSIQISC